MLTTSPCTVLVGVRQTSWLDDWNVASAVESAKRHSTRLFGSKCEPKRLMRVPPCTGPWVGATLDTSSTLTYSKRLPSAVKSTRLLAISRDTPPVIRTPGDSQSSAVAAENVAATSVRLNRQPSRKRRALRSEKCRPCTATRLPPPVPPREGSSVDTVAAAWYSKVRAASDT